MRTIVWAVISTLVAVMAVYGLDISSRRSAEEGVPANTGIQPGFVDNGSEDHADMKPPRYAG